MWGGPWPLSWRRQSRSEVPDKSATSRSKPAWFLMSQSDHFGKKLDRIHICGAPAPLLVHLLIHPANSYALPPMPGAGWC